MRLWWLVLLLISGQAAATPAALHGIPGDWYEWGSGEMTWFGLKLYRATLWVAGQKSGEIGVKKGVEKGVEKAGQLGYEMPLALSLDYRRDIDGERIVRASVDEMRKLGAGEEQLQRWTLEMRRVFPDVKKGDVLTGVHLPDRGVRFFFREREIGEVVDADFARRFFAIWLDPKTSAPDVRAALLRLPER
jgi:hypothetical protein